MRDEDEIIAEAHQLVQLAAVITMHGKERGRAVQRKLEEWAPTHSREPEVTEILKFLDGLIGCCSYE